MAQNTQPEELSLVSTKDPYVQPNLPKKIKQVRFSLMAPGEVVSTGEVNVYQGQLFHLADRTPFAGGPLDPRLGVSNRSATCQTCGQKLADCTGHFGYIKLELPVFHIGYMKATLGILQCICKGCSHVLLDADDRRKFLKRMCNPRLERMQKAATFKAIQDKCKRIKLCPWCGAGNGVVKKATGSLKLFHDKYNQKTHFAQHQAYVEEFEEAMQYNEQIKPHVNKVADDLNPMRVLTLFSAITTEDCILLDVADRPEYLIMTHIPVPPVCIRPSVEMDSGAGSNEDDLTVRLRDIILFNAGLRQDLEKGTGVEQLMEHWDMLQVNCAAYINSDLPGLPANHQAAPTKPTRGFVQRLKGKQGRFRGNLSGKRVDFSGRTVISPDPNLRVDEVCVPKLVAQTLTFPDMVTDHNIEKLRQCVLNGVASWPGANFVMLEGGNKWYLKYGDRRKLAAELKVGDTVERHLMDGDIALFNRQPSLHRMSIMAHRVRVMPWRTFRFNECVCSPYNADFDGDEMNLHVPQTQEAKTEAHQLMGVMNNLCTPKNGEILIAATQDFLTSAFLLTSKDRFYSRSEFCLLCSYMGDAAEQYDLPVPSILKPVELWTGKQVFSAMVQPNTGTRVYVNLETKEKMYTGGEHMCPADGWVCFRNSQLLCGRLGKATLGGGNKAGLYQVLNTDYSSLVAASCMNRLAKLSARFIGNRGFSIGIDDVTPAPRLVDKKQQTVSTGYDKVQDYIQQYAKGLLQLQPGCNMEESLETLVTGVLNNIREQAAKVCMDTLHWHNSPLNMSQCGSKGSPINIAQMVACVGQQSVGGKRCPNGFKDRSLPHFPRGDKTPEGKGFVASSFYSGLSATEFFFHTMAGREGLVDTAVKTAETGYMSRRLMKALEDLYTHYDGTVRNAASGIVQLTYGDDSLDPVSMEGKDGSPIDFVRTLSQIKAATPQDDAPDVVVAAAAAPLPGELLEMLDEKLKEQNLVEGSPKFSGKFISTLKDFILQQVEGLRGVRQRLGLPIEERGPEEIEVAAGVHGLSQRELHGFVDLAVQRYQSKTMDPGSTVGAFGAQSIGEPGTQMTLKTFHFAGVASMNVTLGVPRIKEIINAAKNISTPIMRVALSVTDNVTSARMVKGRLEKTALGQIAGHIKAVLRPREGFISIRLDLHVIAKLQLDVSPRSVAVALINHNKLKLKAEHIRIDGDDGVEIHPAHSTAGKGFLASLQSLLQMVPDVIVQGIPTVERAVISKDEKDNNRYQLLVEGTDLQKVLGTSGVQGIQTDTNDIIETWKFLGIEAARTIIMTEIQKTMGAHGMSIDVRHTMLLADCMTFKGEVLGITRFGISKMKDSVLMLASFEKTTDHLFDAALHGRVDDITGVSESIIMGTPMPVGTGLFKIQHQSHTLLPPPRQLPVLAC